MAVGEEPWAPKKLEKKRGSVLREQNQWGSSGLRQKNETLGCDHCGPGPFPLLFLWRWRGRGEGEAAVTVFGQTEARALRWDGSWWRWWVEGRGDRLRANRGESTATGRGSEDVLWACRRLGWRQRMMFGQDDEPAGDV